MRVLFVTYLHLSVVKGGLSFQIEQTSVALRKAGLEVKFYNPWENCLDDIDLVHVFSSSPSLLPIMVAARRMGKPIVWSTIMSQGGRNLWTFIQLSKLARKIPGFWNHWKEMSKMEYLSDALICLSQHEASLVKMIYPLVGEKVHVIPNGINKLFVEGDHSLFADKFGLEENGYVLHVGYIACEKNQLRLIEAQKQFDKPLAFVGGPGQAGDEYMKKCRALAANNEAVIFAGTFPPGSELLRSAYLGARVFCLPSLFEVQPLTLIEAALAGCCLVASKNVPVMDSLKGHVLTPDPESVHDIAKAVEKAWASPVTARNVMLLEPTWDKIGIRLMNIYESVLGLRN